jgi:hypothetical protein
LVVQRIEARRKRDYDTADTIRNELKEKFGVEINDRKNEWYISSTKTASNSHQQSPLPLYRQDYTEYSVVEDNSDSVTTPDNNNNDDDVGNDDNNEDDNEGWEEDLSKMTVVQLKEKLRSAGLPVSGTKAVLIERLHSSLMEQE